MTSCEKTTSKLPAAKGSASARDDDACPGSLCRVRGRGQVDLHPGHPESIRKRAVYMPTPQPLSRMRAPSRLAQRRTSARRRSGPAPDVGWMSAAPPHRTYGEIDQTMSRLLMPPESAAQPPRAFFRQFLLAEQAERQPPDTPTCRLQRRNGSQARRTRQRPPHLSAALHCRDRGATATRRRIPGQRLPTAPLGQVLFQRRGARRSSSDRPCAAVRCARRATPARTARRQRARRNGSPRPHCPAVQSRRTAGQCRRRDQPAQAQSWGQDISRRSPSG